MHELVFLVGGLLVLAAAVAVVLMQRPSAENPGVIRSGLIEPESPLIPPAGLRPGMVNALATGEISAKDIKLTLLDLAVRGHLTITPGATGSGRPTWQLQRTSGRSTSGLLGYELALLESIATDAPVPLGELAKDPAKPLRAAQTALAEEIGRLGWFSTDARGRHSKWGWIGALVTVAGLLVTASMLIDWAATKDFRGVIGGLAVVAAGILLTSRGRARSLHTPQGSLMQTRVEQLKSALQELRPEEIPPAAASAEFSRLLPWAIGFGIEHQLAVAVDDELRRAANWGQQAALELGWLITDAGSGSATTAHRISAELATVVNRKANGRGHTQRVASHI